MRTSSRGGASVRQPIDAARHGVRVTPAAAGRVRSPDAGVCDTRALYRSSSTPASRLFEYHRSHLRISWRSSTTSGPPSVSSNIDAFKPAAQGQRLRGRSRFRGGLRARAGTALCARRARTPARSRTGGACPCCAALGWLAYQLVRLADQHRQLRQRRTWDSRRRRRECRVRRARLPANQAAIARSWWRGRPAFRPAAAACPRLRARSRAAATRCRRPLRSPRPPPPSPPPACGNVDDVDLPRHLVQAGIALLTRPPWAGLDRDDGAAGALQVVCATS